MVKFHRLHFIAGDGLTAGARQYKYISINKAAVRGKYRAVAFSYFSGPERELIISRYIIYIRLI